MKDVARVWVRLEVRRRGRSLLVLALLVAFAGATVLTAVAGARRGADAVDRLLARTLPATVAVLPNQAGFDWAAVRALPGVAAVTTFPAYTSLPLDERPDDSISSFIPADTEAMRTIERPVVLAGRLPDPARPDEAVVTAGFPAAVGLGVGDTVTSRLATPEQAATAVGAQDTGQPHGPAVRLRIVGVVRSFWYADEVGQTGRLIPSPGLLAAYRANFLGDGGQVPLNGLVRLSDGAAGLPGFRAGLARVGGRVEIDVLDRAEAVRHSKDVIAFESACLLAFGLAAFLAASVLLGQAVVRYGTACGVELRTLVAVGLTRRQGARLGALAPFLAALAGTMAAVALAVLASAWLPFGAAAAREPDPGPDVDLPVLGTGLLLIPALVAVAAWVAAWAGLAPPRRRPPGRRSAVAAAVTSLGLPVTVVVGTRFALEPGRGIPVRPALLGAVTGVLGVLAAFTFSAGVSDAAGNPARFGQNYQLMTVFGFDGRDYLPPAEVLAALARDPDVTGVTDLRMAPGTSRGGTVVTHSFDPAGRPLPLVLTEGHAPSGDDEVVLAPASAELLRARVGDTVPLAGDRGRGIFRVTGIGFGVETSTRGYDTGAWLAVTGFGRLFTGFKEHGGLVALREGADPLAVAARLRQTADGLLVFTPFTPRQFGEIRNVEVLPLALGGFLALLAVGAVGHALVTAVRRRGHDLVVLRALGLTRGQCRLVVATQAATITLLGLLAGVPLGLALGRVAWRVAAGIMPLQYLPPTSGWTLALAGPVALVVAIVLAGHPGRQAGRVNLGQALRAE
ncbi:ABC transporter permease [Acrocarpospora catenulata]|uniref:ABC transporter permease n=1 Tax=Acrocarpospora catenulata TaxID=2836182 RepID=UPI001BDAFF49|nr:ABC transporter permease [Acrocarpospora catenulata]